VPVVYNKTSMPRARVASVMYNKTMTANTPTAPRLHPRMTTTTRGGRPTTEQKGELVAVRLSGRQLHALERRSRREDTGLSEALRRCLDEWTAAHDAAPTHTKEVIKKQRAAATTQPTRRRTRRQPK